MILYGFIGVHFGVAQALQKHRAPTSTTAIVYYSLGAVLMHTLFVLTNATYRLFMKSLACNYYKRRPLHPMKRKAGCVMFGITFFVARCVFYPSSIVAFVYSSLLTWFIVHTFQSGFLFLDTIRSDMHYEVYVDIMNPLLIIRSYCLGQHFLPLAELDKIMFQCHNSIMKDVLLKEDRSNMINMLFLTSITLKRENMQPVLNDLLNTTLPKVIQYIVADYLDIPRCDVAHNKTTILVMINSLLESSQRALHNLL